MHSNKALTSMLFQYGKWAKSIMTATAKKPDDQAEWRNILQLMYHLRRALACSMCGKLALDLYTPIQEICHWVCVSCASSCDGTIQMRHNCITCREALRNSGNGFEINRDLNRLGISFVLLCKYLAAKEIVLKWSSLEVGTQTGPITFGELIQEACNSDGTANSHNLGDKFRKRVKQKEHHCRCGSGAKKNENRGPGNLTCLGQRCACYKEGKSIRKR